MDHIEHLQDIDRKFIWHPFTQMKEWESSQPVVITEARDCFIKDVRGNWYLDGVSSLWVNIHGHRRQEINAAIEAQLNRVAHSTLLGLANVPSILLAERLVGASPQGLTRVFYSDNGSTSVEVALKMAFQYWQHRSQPQRKLFISLQHAYHGDTLGAVSVGGIDIFHSTFGPLLFQTVRAPSPYCYRCALNLRPDSCRLGCVQRMEDILKEHGGEAAAVILEPLVQAAGGMIAAPRGYLRGIRDLCSAYGVLLIADEVATGFGRTGAMFACEHEEVRPDIMCVSKGLTGGYLPLAATLCTEEIYQAFRGDYGELKTFFHGHSYTGNQLGCAAAIACLEVFERDETLKRMIPKVALFEEWLKAVARLDHVGDARGYGLMGGIELVRDRNSKEPYEWTERMGWKVSSLAMGKGLFIRPLGNVVVIMPPLSISLDNLARMLDIIHESIAEATAGR
ncbi:MAG: adenosylmethionine--8-amino-7-oxononanoate transaminase [Thermodesulfovibrionales bacterium]